MLAKTDLANIGQNSAQAGQSSTRGASARNIWGGFGSRRDRRWSLFGTCIESHFCTLREHCVVLRSLRSACCPPRSNFARTGPQIAELALKLADSRANLRDPRPTLVETRLAESASRCGRTGQTLADLVKPRPNLVQACLKLVEYRPVVVEHLWAKPPNTSSKPRRVCQRPSCSPSNKFAEQVGAR